ncbi:hypothetical protein [Sphingobium sp. WCS2017Hpa-17]|uniref:hypothetical protein n=1 Tax=Sphingobium sp. WCS2017Hpa-17 TaxID=3073638 RepID=UPI002889C362|nr:hypothetical protein [Sphingobium sp. WCS2017Hpa-17]
MLAGEALGAGALGAVRVSGLWRGPWGWGVRPDQDVRVRVRDGAMRPEANGGSKVR